MLFTTLIGIDPGATGAAVIRSHSGAVRKVIPYKGHDSVIQTLDAAQVSPNFNPRVGALIEIVWASNKMGPSNAFSFGGNFNGWILACKARGIPVFGLTPQKWQRAIVPEVTGQDKIRKRNLQIAAEVMFDLPIGNALLPYGTRVTLNNADALLISELAVRRNEIGEPLGDIL